MLLCSLRSGVQPARGQQEVQPAWSLCILLVDRLGKSGAAGTTRPASTWPGSSRTNLACQDASLR